MLPAGSRRVPERRIPNRALIRWLVAGPLDLNKQAAAGQAELFPAWRYHAVFTDSPFRADQPDGQQCAAITHNLLRATGSLASLAYGKARGAAIRRDLIDLVAGTARHERGPHHLAPGRRLAARTGVDDPVHRCLRPPAAAA